MEEITKDVFRADGGGNVYLILNSDSEAIVVDTGDISLRNEIILEIESVVPLSRVSKVLLTHLHYDHAGNVDIFPNAEVYASAAALADYRADPKCSFLASIQPEVDKILKSAMSLPKKISGLEVIDVPGHTRGSVAFSDTRRKLLFSGDTLFHRDGIGRTDLPTSVQNEMSSSVGKLRNLIETGDLRLLPGHNY